MSEETDPGQQPETTRAAQPADDPQLVAGRYRIRRTLGRGGGGHVWLAVDEHLGREVALKRVGGEGDAELLTTRGMREARTTAALAHEHVVSVYDAFEHEGAPWIVMEYVPGPSLAEVLADGTRLPPAQVATIGAQVATALTAAHRAGIVHRDVKPGNVLLTGGDAAHAKLTDFGIARAESDAQLTQTGLVSGTAAYFSPELAMGQDPSPASDVWALGATLYAAVEGRRPFRDEANAVAQLHTIAREQPERPEHAGPLTDVLAGLLHPDPQLRWTAEHAAQELGRVAGGAASAQPAPGVWGGAPTAGQTTQTVCPVGPDRTRQVPVATSAVPGTPLDATHARTSRPAAPRPAPSRASAAPPRAAAPARRRRVVNWPVLLAAIPLVAILLWVAWSLVNGAGGGSAEDRASSSAAADAPARTGPVSRQEGEQVAAAFYTDLAYKRLAEARSRLGPDAAVDEEITEGLTRLRYERMNGAEQDDGTVEVTADVRYEYGGEALQQQEVLVLGRPDGGGDPVILSRSTTSVPAGTTPQGGDDEQQQPGQQAADAARSAAEQARVEAAAQAQEVKDKALAKAEQAQQKALEKVQEKAEKDTGKQGDG